MHIYVRIDINNYTNLMKEKLTLFDSDITTLTHTHSHQIRSTQQQFIWDSPLTVELRLQGSTKYTYIIDTCLPISSDYPTTQRTTGLPLPVYIYNYIATVLLLKAPQFILTNDKFQAHTPKVYRLQHYLLLLYSRFIRIYIQCIYM